MMTTNGRWKCWRDPSHEVGDHPVFGWPQCQVCRAAPPYHERAALVPEDLELGVYVLREGSPAAMFVAPGSGVVGLPSAPSECDDCGGTGAVPISGGEPEDEVDNGYKRCPTCNGTGQDFKRVRVYYEGWTHGAAQYEGRDERGRWEAGVWHAADRMVTEYPTSAQAALRPGDLLRVGSFHPSRHQLVVDDERALTAWLGSDTPA